MDLRVEINEFTTPRLNLLDANPNEELQRLAVYLHSTPRSDEHAIFKFQVSSFETMKRQGIRGAHAEGSH